MPFRRIERCKYQVAVNSKSVNNRLNPIVNAYKRLQT